MLNTGLHVAAKKLGNKAKGASMSLEEYIANTRPPRASGKRWVETPGETPGEPQGKCWVKAMGFRWISRILYASLLMCDFLQHVFASLLLNSETCPSLQSTSHDHHDLEK